MRITEFGTRFFKMIGRCVYAEPMENVLSDRENYACRHAPNTAMIHPSGDNGDGADDTESEEGRK
jgi:hypothetical protein